jgi:Leucine-rich repeat (LRR) protein
MSNVKERVKDVVTTYVGTGEVRQRIKVVKERGNRELALKDCGLKAIPRPVFKLVDLKKLVLSHNILDHIDSKIGNFQVFLHTFDSFPFPSCISSIHSKNVQDLEELDLSYNNLEELPEEMGQLKKLKVLNIENNKIATIPPALSFRLTHLNIGGNRIVYFTNQFAAPMRSTLVEFNYSGSGLKMISPEVFQMTKLARLDLSINGLSSIPVEFQNLAGTLTYLNLASNQITTIHPVIGTLKKLVYLNLSVNSIEKLPEELFSLTALEVFFSYRPQMTYIRNSSSTRTRSRL